MNALARFFRPALAAAAAWLALAAQAAPTEVTLMRFFGSCDAKYGSSTDARSAVGECGIITSLVNDFNARHAGRIVVKPQIAEWGPFYDQLVARIVARDVPTITVMHESLLGDYVRRGLIEPLDEGLAAAGVDVADFTDHARQGVTHGGKVYALPFDTWSWLWHFNMALMRQAKLVNADGSPRLPRSRDELLAHARQFRQATGKPYFAWAAANEPSANSRTFLTLVSQQGGRLFADNGRSIDMQRPEAREALSLMRQLYQEGHVAPNQDYAGANQLFLNGQAGVSVIGTWTIDQYIAESKKPGAALGGGYWVTPFPQLYARPAAYADGHAWVLLKRGLKDEPTRQAAFAVLKDLYQHGYEWSRTGHLPTSRKVAASAEFKALPFRDGLAEITRTGVGMPGNVPVQRRVEALIGEDVGNAVVSGKPMDAALANIDKRVNATLKRAHRGTPGH